MTRRLAAVCLVVLFAAMACLAAERKPQRKTWMDQVHDQARRNIRAVGREVRSWMIETNRQLRAARRGTARGLASLTRSGRQGMDYLQTNLARSWGQAFAAAHRTVRGGARTVSPEVGIRAETRAPTVVARELTSPVIDPVFLRRHDIVLAWKTSTGGLPIRRSLVLEDRILLEDTANELYSFGPRNGIVQWVYPLPRPSQFAYREDENHIFVVAGDMLFELDRTIGMPRRRIVFPFPCSGPPLMVGDLVVVPSWERRVYAMRRDTRVKVWTYLPAAPVEAGLAMAPATAFVADTSGTLTAYSPVDRRTEWEYKADDAIRVTPLKEANFVIFPAEDLWLHCVNRFGGFRSWKVPVQGFITQQPWVEGDRCYFSANGDALYCVDIYKDGQILWRVPNGGWPVAMGKANIYIQGPNREIWAIDRETGKTVWTVSAEPFTYFVRNTDTDHLYLCSDEGDVYALYLRGDHLEKKKPVAPPLTPEKPTEPEVEKPTEGEPRVPGAGVETPRTPKGPAIPAAGPPARKPSDLPVELRQNEEFEQF